MSSQVLEVRECLQLPDVASDIATSLPFDILRSNSSQNGARRQLSVVLPAYKEAERQTTPNEQPGYNYQKTLEEYTNALDNYFPHRNQWGMTVIDDGSPLPGTAELARKAGVEVLTYATPGNHGKGAAYQLGFLSLAPKSHVVGAYDSDGSYHPKTIIQQYEAIAGGADMAIAYRPETPDQHQDKRRAIAHNLLRTVRECLAPTGLHDTQAGAFALSSEAATFLFNRKIKQRWAVNHQIARIAVLADISIAQNEQSIRPRGGSTLGDSFADLSKAALGMVIDSTFIGIRHNRFTGLKSQWNDYRLQEVRR